MPIPDRVLLFAQSQRCRMQFGDQHAVIVQRKGNAREINAFAVRRRTDPSRGAFRRPSN
jgi:hypothetical protein